MARIIIGSYAVRYPLGGILSWALQWLAGFQRLGHDVYLVEKSGYPNSCYDPSKDVANDDYSYGLPIVDGLLARFGLGDNWCYVDAQERYHGLSRERVAEVFRSAELFIDMGMYEWLAEAANAKQRIFLDGEPGFTQMQMANGLAGGGQLPNYDSYYSNGVNIGAAGCTAPTAGIDWHPVLPPVVVDLFPIQRVDTDAAFTTVMHWQSHNPIEFDGTTYGQKDVEFAKFMALPQRTAGPLEVAVSGVDVPTRRLIDSGWRVRHANDITISIDSYYDYIRASRGEFSVCKNVFVATNSGWFSERSAIYLASGRPVVLQDTGFSAHLPCGEGLFAVRTVDEAAAAIEAIQGDYERHSRRAREIAVEYLDAPKVLGGFLRELGIER